MAKKSMKEAAAAGTTVLDQIASGNVIDIEPVRRIRRTADANDGDELNKEGLPLTRLNLKIPAKYQEYLTIAAAKASIEQRQRISLTKYLCELIQADMDKNNYE